MTQIIKSRKERANFTIEQKLDYAKLMVNENYSNKKIIAISGAGPSAVTRWKKQYNHPLGKNWIFPPPIYAKISLNILKNNIQPH
jgi:transposase